MPAAVARAGVAPAGAVPAAAAPVASTAATARTVSRRRGGRGMRPPAGVRPAYRTRISSQAPHSDRRASKITPGRDLRRAAATG
jgi:hypothetical protein